MSETPQVTRRQLVEGMGIGGMLGIAGMFLGNAPKIEIAYAAEEAAEAAAETGEAAATAAPTSTIPDTPIADIMTREIEAAKAENRRLNYLNFLTELSTDELDAMLEDEAEVTEDYTTPGGKVIPALYIRLRNRINRLAAGLGSIVPGDDHWDVMMDFWSEEDAEHFLAMPVTKDITAVDYAERLGIGEQEAHDILEDLADRSLIWRLRRGGQARYQPMAQIPGYWEWHELWEGAHGTQEEMLKFNKGCDSAWGMEDHPLAFCYQPSVHVQACDNSIVDGEVPAYADWEASLERFDKFSVMDCQCRTKQLNYGTKTPEECGRMDTCTSMGEIAEYFISIGVARELTKEEARENIRKNVEEGNTIEGFCTKSGGAYCACNMNVCLFANAYARFGGNANSHPYLSDLRLAYDTDACIQCGACFERCPMNCIEQDEDGFYQPTAICFSCGQCATVCPAGARKLKAKEKWETFERSQDLFEDNLNHARAHMALGGIADFTGDNLDEIREQVAGFQAHMCPPIES